MQKSNFNNKCQDKEIKFRQHLLFKLKSTITKNNKMKLIVKFLNLIIKRNYQFC